MAKRTGIQDLPVEILQMIFCDLNTTSTEAKTTKSQSKRSSNNLVNVVRTSQQWRIIGLPILATQVVLRTNTFATLEPWTIPMIQSLTLHLEPTPPRKRIAWLKTSSEKYTETLRLVDSLQAFAGVMRRMSRLTTFTLRMRKPQGWKESWISPSHLAKILEALPKSCVNLEVDIDGFDQHGHGRDGHLCGCIRELVPRIKNLRLRLESVCPELLRPTSTKQCKEEVSVGKEGLEHGAVMATRYVV